MTDLRSKVAEEIWNVTEGGDENPYNEAMTTDQDIARLQADAAIAIIGAGVERGNDLDALLDSVHWGCQLDLYHRPPPKGTLDEWIAEITHADESGNHWPEWKGTGPTRLAAIKDAVAKAKEVQHG